MNKINLSPVEKMILKIRQTVEKREEYWNSKSEKWQESDKGDEYTYRTTELETLADDLDSWFTEAEQWNDAD